MVTINIPNRTLYTIIGAVIVIALAVGVNAYNDQAHINPGDPEIMGHSVDELDLIYPNLLEIDAKDIKSFTLNAQIADVDQRLEIPFYDPYTEGDSFEGWVFNEKWSSTSVNNNNIANGHYPCDQSNLGKLTTAYIDDSRIKRTALCWCGMKECTGDPAAGTLNCNYAWHCMVS